MYVFDQLLELKSEKYVIFNDLRIQKARNRENNSFFIFIL